MTNVVLLMADQLPASALPVHGDPVARTPHIARLAGEGMVFENAYCTSPLCAPSRAALLTGRRPSATGVYDNAAELPASIPTIAHLARAAGSATCLAGKMHFVGPDQLHGYEERLTTDVYPAGFDWTPDWRLPTAEPVPWYHNMASIRLAGVHEAAMQTDYDDEVAFRSVQWLRDRLRGRHSRPFFLTVSFTNPHDPWEVRRRHWDMYEGIDVGRPEVDVIPREQADPHSLRLRDMYGSDLHPLTADETRVARRAYFAALSYLDERVGEVLQALDDTGLAGDTVVLLTSDHGEMLGERGLWYKMSFFDGSARVPLIVRGPGVARGRVAGPVSQLDIAPTIAELLSAPAGDSRLEGESLAAVLRGEAPGPARAVGEYLAEGVRAPAVMIRRGPLKYVRCPGDPDLLFDLDADPNELVDLAASGEAVERLRAESDTLWDLERLEQDVLDSQRRRRLVGRALARGAHFPWDFHPFTDASVQFVRGDAAANERPWRLRPRGDLPASDG